MSAKQDIEPLPKAEASAVRQSSTNGTAGFYLACYLRGPDYELAGLRQKGQYHLFVYYDRPNHRHNVLAFYGNRTSVVPLRFPGAIRDLKALLHNG